LLIKPETLHAFNARVSTIATELKVTRGQKLRTDGTVVETAIAYPSDSQLLTDGVRVLSRVLKRTQAFLSENRTVSKERFRNRTRSAKLNDHRLKGGGFPKERTESHYQAVCLIKIGL
jgi:IS5 family transposase